MTSKIELIRQLRGILDAQQPVTVTGPNGQATITIPPCTSLLSIKDFVESCIAFGAEQQKDSDVHRWNEASTTLLAALAPKVPLPKAEEVWIVRDEERYVQGVFANEQAARKFKAAHPSVYGAAHTICEIIRG